MHAHNIIVDITKTYKTDGLTSTKYNSSGRPHSNIVIHTSGERREKSILFGIRVGVVEIDV